MKILLFRPCWLILVLLLTQSLYANSDSLLFKVGICEEPPFVLKQGDVYTGLSIDLWKQIAKHNEVAYELIPYNDQLGLLRALDFGEVDIAINPLHVNAIRLRLFEVTQPFFVSSIGVAVSHAQRSQFMSFIRNFFSLDFFRIILLLVFIIFVFGTMLWIAERNHNDGQFRKEFIGLFDGLWWSAVTMTTVGYGDKAPKTKAGRIIAMIWMFTAVIIISGFTASIASTLTVSSLSHEIDDLHDIRNAKSVGTVIASSSQEFLQQNQVGVNRIYDNIELALDALARNEIEILVYDSEVLEYFIDRMQLSKNVTLLPITFNKQNKGFMLSKNSTHIDWVNTGVVESINLESWKAELRKYNLVHN